MDNKRPSGPSSFGYAGPGMQGQGQGQGQAQDWKPQSDPSSSSGRGFPDQSMSSPNMSRGRGAGFGGAFGGRGRGATTMRGMANSFDGVSRGGRGGRGTGSHGNMSRGRGAGAAAGAPSTRGARAAFTNRSVVFNKRATSESEPNSDTEDRFGEEEEEGERESETIMPQSAEQESASEQRGARSSFAQPPTEFAASVWPTDLPLRQSNALGENLDTDAERKRRFENLPKQNRFFELRAVREAARARYIAEGVLPDPDKPQDLAAAKTFRGTCTDMCPEFEREEREFQNEGDPLEMFPGSTRLDPVLTVKIYRRPAAGRELPLPEDVRPPEVLRQTLDYLIHDLLPSDPSTPRFTAVQPFMWNRTRAIRQDFIVQGERGPLAIECHERIARYHILCLHWRGGVGAEGWSEQQELEQLRKTIRSLTEFYEDLRRSKGTTSPNEAEFRAYNLLLHMSDPETLREVEALPSNICDAEPVRAALALRMYAQRSNNTVRRGRPANTEATLNLWTRFFGLLRKRESNISYLLACLAENAFSSVRAGALKAMSKTYLQQHAPLPLDYLQRSLGMDSADEVRSFAVSLGCEEVFAERGDDHLLGLRLTKANDDVPLPTAPFSQDIVERKRGLSTSQDVVNGKVSGAVPLIKLAEISSRGGTTAAQIYNDNRASSERPKIIPPEKPDVESKETKHDVLGASIPPRSTFASLSAKAPSFTPASAAYPQPVAPVLSLDNRSTAVESKATVTTTEGPAAKSSEPTFRFAPSPAPIVPPKKSLLTASPTKSFQPQEHKETAETGKTRSSPAFPRSTVPQIALQQAQAESLTSTKQSSPSNDKHDVSDEVQDKQVSVSTSSVAQPVEQKALKIKRDTAKGLFEHLCKAFLAHKVDAVAQQALLKESRIRRKCERDRFVRQTVETLTSQLLEEVIEEQIAAIGADKVALEKSRRTLCRTTLKHWKRRLDLKQEQAKQSERLEAIRSKLAMHDVRWSKHAHLRRGTARINVGRGDDNLEARLRESRKHVESLWLPSTFLWATVIRVQRIAKRDMDVFTVGIQVANPSGSSSQWLLSKFSLHEDAVMEIDTPGNTLVRSIDLRQCSGTEWASERDLGLVVFELDPPGKMDDDSTFYWAAQRQRLESLGQSEIVRSSQMLPKLLILGWGAHRLEGQSTDLRRKYVFKSLSLRATDNFRFHWSQTGYWDLSDNQQGEDTQDTYEAHLSAILGSIEWNRHLTIVSFDDLVSTAASGWSNLLERADKAMQRLLQQAHREISSGANDEEIRSIIVDTFMILSRLLRRVLDDIVAVSIFDIYDFNRLGESLNVSAHAIEIPHTIEIEKTPFILASRQLKNVGSAMRAAGVDDADIAIHSHWLSSLSHQQQSSFPWQTYFFHLSQSLITHLGKMWLEAALPTIEDVHKEVQPSHDLCLQAATDIQSRVREAIQRREIVSAEQTQIDDDVVMDDVEHDSLDSTNPSRNRPKGRVSSLQRTKDSFGAVQHPIPSLTSPATRSNKIRRIDMSSQSPTLPAPTALTGLRSVIANANRLLAEHG